MLKGCSRTIVTILSDAVFTDAHLKIVREAVSSARREAEPKVAEVESVEEIEFFDARSSEEVEPPATPIVPVETNVVALRGPRNKV